MKKKTVKKKTYYLKPEEFVTILKLLIKKYPKCFSFVEVKPLKIGIKHDIAAALKCSKTKINRFLEQYCQTEIYMKTRKDGIPRYDLEGNICGYVNSKIDYVKKTSFTKNNK